MTLNNETTELVKSKFAGWDLMKYTAEVNGQQYDFAELASAFSLERARAAVLRLASKVEAKA